MVLPGDTVAVIPRSREVGQPFAAAVVPTLRAIVAAFRVLLAARPDLVLLNGPGVCLPVLCAAFALRFLGVRYSHTLFLESVCRVRSLSLTGALAYPFVDRFVVQWPQLCAR